MKKLIEWCEECDCANEDCQGCVEVTMGAAGIDINKIVVKQPVDFKRHVN